MTSRAGEPWLSFKKSKGRVLFLNFEIHGGFFQQRIEAVAREKHVKLAPGKLGIGNLRGHAAGYEIILPRITDRVKDSDCALIVLDPIYKLYGDTDENSAGALAELLNGIESLMVNSGASVAFGAHYSKGNQAGKEAIDRISGSGVFDRDLDSILNLTRHEEQAVFTVSPVWRLAGKKRFLAYLQSRLKNSRHQDRTLARKTVSSTLRYRETTRSSNSCFTR